MMNIHKIRSTALQARGIFILLAFWFLGNVPGLQAEPKLIDLTHNFNETTIYWPTSKSFKLAPVHKGATAKGFWYEANNYEAAEHGGTHMDAPIHFAKGKWTVDQIPLSSLIAPGVLIDISAKAKGRPDTLISEQDVLDWETLHGSLPPGVIVL
jgi:kynurenine formamidase